MDIDSFIARWGASGGAERANYAQFLSELCRVLGVPEPEPTRPDDADNAYVFERSVADPHDEGRATVRRIDLYRRGCFVLEAKQGVEREVEAEAQVRQSRRGQGKRGHGTRGTKGWDTFMQRARQQAESYVRLLPGSEGRPPFIVVVDVGHAIELYAEFSRTGGVYRPFPNAREHRLSLDDLRDPRVRERLRAVWLEPLSLDPSLRAAEVTKQVADTLARLSRSLEGQPGAAGGVTTSEGVTPEPPTPERVSGFLMRMIFTMFAEDVGLIPGHKFRGALTAMRGRPEAFVPTVQDLWRAMAGGGYSVALGEHIRHFNGGLFEDVEVLPVTGAQLELFIEAAERDWSEVEPSIFGTLVERALNPRERHKLGAHYTPRGYVERLVEQTVMVPLQADWQNVQVEVQNALARAEGERALAAATMKARGFVEAFLAGLRGVSVLDPACGTGNFLYVAMELMKRLEAEAVETLVSLGGQAPLLGVSPEQFLGLELNPRAARVAELVLWIGYLQLYSREHPQSSGRAAPPEPILKAFHNIKQQDAVLAFDARRPKLDDEGRPVTRWDGVSMSVQAATGRAVPDGSAVVYDEVYENPRPAPWPPADFIVGNPPFIGAGPMRFALGDGYTETLRKTYPEVPESADFVMFWWYRAAQLLTSENRLRRFGFVTTNSLKQTFNRRVLERFLGDGLSLAYAVPDHPWVDEADGAAVRIAMTVAQRGGAPGVLSTVVHEATSGSGHYTIETRDELGTINPDLTVGVDVTAAKELRALEKLAGRGVQLMGAGFIVTREKAVELGLGVRPGLEQHIREYRNGKDLTNRPRDVLVIDLFGLTVDEVRDRFPEVYQHVLVNVKPERDAKSHSKDGAGYAKLWWLFGKPRQELRKALPGLSRYIATSETSKHRFFQFLDASVLPDNMLVTIAHDDAYVLGVLSSRIHVVWALAQGGTLEDRPRYNKSRCFDTFPFPDPSEAQQEAVRELAERLDAFRKARLSEHPKLTMTAMYNVLDEVRAGRELSAKDRATHDQGLVSTLLSLHDDLDAAVAAAYGWAPGLPTQEVLARLLALNALRAHEERAGRVRYLRPAYQDPNAAQQEGLGIAVVAAAPPTDAPLTFPGKLSEQAQAVRQVLQTSSRPLGTLEVARRFRGARGERIGELLELLVELGQARQVGEQEVAFAA